MAESAPNHGVQLTAYSHANIPDMLAGSMRVSSDNDRQMTDLQRDALLDAGSIPGSSFWRR